MTNDERKAILQRHAAQLSEHFSSVVIVAVHDEPTQSHRMTASAGNWYANCAAIMETANAMAARLEPAEPPEAPEEGDEWKQGTKP